jgi:hypothetical protein
VRPGDRLDLKVEAIAIGDDAARATGTAFVGGKRVAVAEIMYAMLDVDKAATQLDEGQKTALFAWSDRVWRDLRGEP